MVTPPEVVVPPHDIFAEQAVLGAMLQGREIVTNVERELSADSFYRPTHGMVFEAILDLVKAGEPADAVTITRALAKRDWLDKVGTTYAHTLIESVPTVANAGHYTGIVANHAGLRNIAAAALSIAQLAYTPGADLREVAARAQALIHAVTVRSDIGDATLVADFFNDVLADAENPRPPGTTRGVPTGFADLDEATDGLYPGQLWVIAARPAVGKSVLGLDICRSASIRHGVTSALFSLEMTGKEIATRLLSAEAKVNLSALRNGRLVDGDWSRIARRIGEIAEAPLFIDDSPQIMMPDIMARSRRLKQTHDLRLVVVDYLQLMSSPRRVDSREQEVGSFARDLKLMAKELEIPVVALAQINRGPEQRTDKRPTVSDIRESGAIEAHADGIILLYREDEVDKESARAGEADFILGKNRNGAKGTITVAFQGHYSRFVDMAN